MRKPRPLVPHFSHAPQGLKGTGRGQTRPPSPSSGGPPHTWTGRTLRDRTGALEWWLRPSGKASPAGAHRCRNRRTLGLCRRRGAWEAVGPCPPGGAVETGHRPRGTKGHPISHMERPEPDLSLPHTRALSPKSSLTFQTLVLAPPPYPLLLLLRLLCFWSLQCLEITELFPSTNPPWKHSHFLFQTFDHWVACGPISPLPL